MLRSSVCVCKRPHMKKLSAAHLFAMLYLMLSTSVIMMPSMVSRASAQQGEGPGGVKYTLLMYNNTLVEGAVPHAYDEFYSLRAPYGIAYDTANGYLYVVNDGSNSVSVLDPSTNSVVARVA